MITSRKRIKDFFNSHELKLLKSRGKQSVCVVCSY
jgi:hypothetical protein